MTILWIDFETRSRCDLKAKGVYNYAQDLSTEVLCMSYAFDDDEVVTWLPGQPFPEVVAQHKGQIRAHNAAFERLIFWYVLQIDYDLEQFYCTAAQARANCAPGSLEDVGRFAGASMKKDYRGAELIRKLCVPQSDGQFREDAGLMAEMIAYCEQDVRAMRAISKGLRELTTDELTDYHVNERINDRGVLLDRELALAAVRYSDVETAELQAIVAEVTHGLVTSVRSPKMRQWVWDRVGPQAQKLMTVWKDGEKKQSIDKNVRASLLVLAEENPDEIPADVAEVIQCADDLWASSVAKFARAAALADEDDRRVRGAFMFAGGSATGRASSLGLQVHNYPRRCAPDADAVRQAMARGHDIVPTYGERVTDVLKGMLRPSLTSSPGKVLVVADWSSIEARVNPWLSNSKAGVETLEVFASGRDIYCREAAAILRQPEKDIVEEYERTGKSARRQLGKVAILACGFSGGVGAFASMGRIYGVNLPEYEAQRTINAWRRANAWAEPFWRTLEWAYKSALRRPGKVFEVGRVQYLFDRQHLWYALPSGRVLCYPFARFEDGDVTYAKAAWKPAADATEWPRARLWRGLACENCWSKDTRLLTSSGVKSIRDVTLSDRLWDGVEWVPHAGVVCNGEQEVVAWAGQQVTPNHQIFDGKQWKAVIDLDDRTTDGCLTWARASGPWLSARAMGGLAKKAASRWPATADASTSSQSGRYAKARSIAPRAPRNSIWSALTLSPTTASALCGSTAEPARSPGVTTRATRHGPTTGGEASASTSLGSRAGKSGCATPSLFPAGIISLSTWTVSTTTATMNRVISGLSRAARTALTAAARRASKLKAALFLSANFGRYTAPAGAATTASPTISPRGVPVTKSPRATGQREVVYDIVNCGPRSRYTVITPFGPVIAHNCTQAVANDLLRHSLRQLEPLGVVLHVHDEIVVECDAPDLVAREIERVMTTPPAWAEGLPLAVEVSAPMTRYSKG